jgi:hypothetical protein
VDFPDGWISPMAHMPTSRPECDKPAECQFLELAAMARRDALRDTVKVTVTWSCGTCARVWKEPEAGVNDEMIADAFHRGMRCSGRPVSQAQIARLLAGLNQWGISPGNTEGPMGDFSGQY